MRSVKLILVVTAALLCVAADAAAHLGYGRNETILVAGQTIEAGQVDIWNNGKQLDASGVDVGSKLMIQVFMEPGSPWYVSEVQIYVGPEDGEIPMQQGNPKLGHFPYKQEYPDLTQKHTLILDLDEDLGFSWGQRHSRVLKVAVHADLVRLDEFGNVVQEEGAWAWAGESESHEFGGSRWGWYFTKELAHPRRGHVIDKPVKGLGYVTPTHAGTTGGDGLTSSGFWFFAGEEIDLFIGPPTYDSTYSFYLGRAEVAKTISPVDLFSGADTDDPRVVGVARVLQTLDSHESSGPITIEAGVAACFNGRANALGFDSTMFGAELLVDQLIADVVTNCATAGGVALEAVSAADAQKNLEAGLNLSGNFRKNVSKTEDWGETKQKLEVMPVYFPALRSNGNPSYCCFDDDGVTPTVCDPLVCESDPAQCTNPGVPYEEWRFTESSYCGGADILSEACECDPKDDVNDNNVSNYDEGICVLRQVECRDIAKPLLVTYLEKVDISDPPGEVEFEPDRFSWDVYTAVSRDDGATWKRMNVSRMADLSSFELEDTEEPFPGTTGSPYLKIDDNLILNVWESKFCKSGNPRYSIVNCEATPDLCDWTVPDEPCFWKKVHGEDVCEPDYPYDNPYYVTDIWGVRGQQQSVDYDEVDDVADLGIGEIPYSCLWAARGVIVSQKELDEGTFASLTVDDPADCTAIGVPYDCCTGPGVGDTCVPSGVELGDIVWFKPERITSGRRDAYIPVVNSARGAGFAIAWQEDPKGLRPGKGKGPGEGWSGAISNHKTDIWYTYITSDDFAVVDANFMPGGPGNVGDDPNGEPNFDVRPGLGRPKALVPFALPVRISDNDMVNTNTLKVQPGTDCPDFPDTTGEYDPVCFPLVEEVEGVSTFVPLDPDEIAALFCDPGAPVASGDGCCHPDHHNPSDEFYDEDCDGLQGLYGNLRGTKRYAYLARDIDELDNVTGEWVLGGDGIADYQYYLDREGEDALDLCDTSGANTYMNLLPGTSEHERWYGFTNAAGKDKLVCVSSDGRMLDGDVFAARPMLQLQPYTRSDGTRSAWALLAYEESKGLGHSLAAAEHEDELIGGGTDGDPGQDKPIKQDLGKNLLYHTFDFTQPDLVAPGHIVNLPALCGGLYPTWCDDRKTNDAECTAPGVPYDCCTGPGQGDCVETNPDNVTCTCDPGLPVPLYFDRYVEDPTTGEGQWLPQEDLFLQYRTEIARRARFLVQSYGKMGDSRTAGAVIFKQGQEGQGRPADAFIRRFVVPTQVLKPDGTSRNFSPKIDNPFAFENIECTTYLDQDPVFGTSLPGCPTDGIAGYNCNVWGEHSGDRLCGGTFDETALDGTTYTRRDHINLTSANVDLGVGVGPDADPGDPLDPTDDVYSRIKVLLWSQVESNLGDESYGYVDGLGAGCDILAGSVCPGMYSNVRSHRGFIRGDFFAVAYALSPNWAAARNGNDRYNFYVRRSFDGGLTWTTTPADLGGEGVFVCPEYRTDPYYTDPDGTGNLPPDLFDQTCGTYDVVVPLGETPPRSVGLAMVNYLGALSQTPDGVYAQYIGAGAFEPARNISQIKSNKETSADPRLGATPPTYPLDGTTGGILCPSMGEAGTWECIFPEDEYIDNMFFVAWGTADNAKSTGGDSLKTEATPLDLYYTRTVDYGDDYFMLDWDVGGANSNQAGEVVWRYDFLAKGEPEEQGECQLKATADGSKVYAIFHSMIPGEDDADPSRWYPWKPEVTYENDLWFRRVIFWPELDTVLP